ncbi:MAG: PAS domain-containing protein [Dehalococcoidia bacterium]
MSFLTLARRLLEDRRLTLRERLQRLVDITPWVLNHGDVAEVGVFFEQLPVTTAGFRETPWMLGAAIPSHSGATGRLCIALSESPGGPDMDPFSPAERQLVEVLAQIVSEAIERDEASEAEVALTVRDTTAHTLARVSDRPHSGPALRDQLGSEYLHRLLSAVPSMAYRRLADSRWTLQFASLGCRAVTGFDPHDLMGSGLLSYADLIKGRDRIRVQPQVHEAVLRGKAFQATYTIRRVDGTERSVLDLGWPSQSEDDGGATVEGLVIDVTEALHDARVGAGPEE